MLDETGVTRAPQAAPRLGIAIGIASSGRPCPPHWGVALATMTWPAGTNLTWAHVVAQSIDSARNRIVEEALDKGSKYLWFLDDDTIPPRNAVTRLVDLLDQEEAKGSNVRVAGGIYCIKQDPPSPLVFKQPGSGPFWGWKVGDIFPVWGIGTGCMLIRTDVFKELPRPWFKTTHNEDFSETDDLYFCAKIANAGYGVLAHGGIICPHWDVANNLIYTLPAQSYPMLPRVVAPEPPRLVSVNGE